MKTKLKALLISVVFITSIQAKINIASVLGDNMVLQRNTEVKLWGTASPNENLSIVTGWNKIKTNLTADKNGKWLIKVKTTEAGGPYNITIAASKEKLTLKNILLGEVWLCSGQSNMQMPVQGWGAGMLLNGSNELIFNADNSNIRLFNVKRMSVSTPQESCVGDWAVASSETVAPFSAVAYLYGKKLQEKLHVPIGIICSCWGASSIEAWMDNETIAQFPDALKRSTREKMPAQQKASCLYNGMIAPIINYTIKGAIWYQGESNKDYYKDYAAEQASMVASWRKAFGVGNFPFYYVQIAPFAYGNSKAITSALERDEQLKAMALIPNSGMVSTFDIGEEKCIHPAEKATVANRLAYWAMAETYGCKGLAYKTPTFKDVIFKSSDAILQFDNAPNGFTTFGKEVQCFELAGTDSIFHPAILTLTQKELKVSSPDVKNPVAVRYGFCNFPKTQGYLYNTAGLPVPSFRSDNWIK
jgi:sialate O-acetylesterase